MANQPLKKIDRIMWDADTPKYPNSICGMMTFSKKVSRKKILEVLENRLLRFKRFKQSVILIKNIPHWHTIEDFEIKNHIKFHKLNTDEGFDLIQAELSKLMSFPLNDKEPLWNGIVYEGYKGGTAIIFRLHHAIADGAALINVLFSLTGSSAKSSLEFVDKKSGFSFKDLPFVKGIQNIVKTTGKVMDEAKHVWEHPEVIRENLIKSYNVAKDAASILSNDVVTGKMYKGEFSENKLVAWNEGVDLNVIKALGKKYHGTVNDVLLALMAGAVRQHLLKHKQEVNEGMRIVIPVNLRGEKDKIELHNEIGMISLELPVHLNTFLKRLKFVNEKTSLLKSSPEPFLLSKLMEGVADYLPKNAKDKVIDFLATKISAAITNVPGPKTPVYFAGVKVEEIHCWIPHSAPLGIGLSMLSYNNKVTTGLVIDENMANDPVFLLNAFIKEYKKAKRLLEKN